MSKSGGFEELEVKELVGFEGVFYKFQDLGTFADFSVSILQKICINNQLLDFR